MDPLCVDLTVEFLGVAFHNILYYTSVYPKSVFEKRKKYNLVVYRCIHPDVNNYLDRCLSSIEIALKSDGLLRVELVIRDVNLSPGMKFLFDFERMAAYDETADAYLVRCEQNLRAFCLLISTVSHKFNSSPVDCSFDIYFYTNESTEAEMANMPDLDDFPLMEAEVFEATHNVMPLRRFSIRDCIIETFIVLPQPWSFCS